MLFDTHAHLDNIKYDNDRQKLLDTLQEKDVSLMLNSGADLKGCAESIALANQYDFVYASVGIHPHEAHTMSEDTIEVLRNMATQNTKVVAIGEIGLDYFYDNSPREVQRTWFARQMELALELKMPVVIHNRDAHADTLSILKENHIEKIGGTMHCFSGSYETAKEIVKMGMYVSFSGSLTFKSARNLHETAFKLPIEHILIETDCPYLTPEPHRGKRNESAYVRHVAEKIAELKGISWQEVARITKENGMKLYGIK